MAPGSSQFSSQQTVVHDVASSLVSPEGYVLCFKCGERASRFISNTPKNPNRVFWKCDKCGTFKWGDQLPPHIDEDPSLSRAAAGPSSHSNSASHLSARAPVTPHSNASQVISPPPPYTASPPPTPQAARAVPQTPVGSAVTTPVIQSERAEAMPRVNLKRARSPSPQTPNKRPLHTQSSAYRLQRIREAIRNTPSKGDATPGSNQSSAHKPISSQARTSDSHHSTRPTRLPAPDFSGLASQTDSSQGSHESEPRVAQTTAEEDDSWEHQSIDTPINLDVSARRSRSQRSLEDSPLAGKGKGKAIDLDPFDDDIDASGSASSQPNASSSREAIQKQDDEDAPPVLDFQRLFSDLERLPLYVRNLERQVAHLSAELERERASKAQVELAMKHLLDSRHSA